MGSVVPPRAVRLFVGFALDLNRSALLAPGGAEVPLGPKSFALLRLLAENAGRLLGRDEIMDAVWPGEFATDDSITRCVLEIRRALGDKGQRVLRTVPKRGYLFAAEVTSGPLAAVDLAAPKPARPGGAEAETMPRVRRRLAAILAADLVGYSRLLAEDEAATLAALRGMRAELLEPLAEAHGGRVFATMGDGFLAEFPSSVLALRCALALQAGLAERGAGRPEPERFAFRIGVDQGEVVEEGDGITGDGVNVAVRLQALAEPGGICMSGRVREDVAGKLALDPDDLGERALKNIPRPVRAFHVPGANSARTRANDNEVLPSPLPVPPDREVAQRLYREGYRRAWRESGPEEWLVQRDLFRRAVAADPSFAPAWTQLVFTYTNMVGDGHSPNPSEDLRAAEQAAERALALTPEDPWAHAALGSVLRIQPDRLEEALAAYQRALALDSGQHGARGMIGRLLILLGRFREAEIHLRTVIASAPEDHVYTRFWLNQLGLVDLLLGRGDYGAQHFRRALWLAPLIDRDHHALHLAAALTMGGRVGEASQLAEEIRRRQPDLTVASLRRAPSASYHPTYITQRERFFLTPLARAGLPE
jgi:class 3 adenylate cyclase